MEDNPEKPVTTAAPWYSRKGLPTWLVIAIILAILATIPFTPTDAPARLWIFLVAVLVAIALYVYTHPKDEAIAAAKQAAEAEALRRKAGNGYAK